MNKTAMRYGIIGLLNSVVIYLMAVLAQGSVVLGTDRYTPVAAAVVSGFILVLIGRLVKISGLATKISFLKGRNMMFGYYWLVNSIGIWVIARIAPLSGLGIAAFYWAIILGFVLNLAQWGARQGFKEMKLV